MKRNEKLSSLTSHLSSQKGFTLIELMVVLSITAVLGTLGIAGFTTYNQIQVLQTSANDVVTMLNLARSRAQSQIKPSALCSSSEILEVYGVEVFPPPSNMYRLYLRCSGRNRVLREERKRLPSGLSFNSGEYFLFPIQTGGVQRAGQIIISGYGRSKTVTVNSLGGVSVQ